MNPQNIENLYLKRTPKRTNQLKDQSNVTPVNPLVLLKEPVSKKYAAQFRYKVPKQKTKTVYISPKIQVSDEIEYVPKKENLIEPKKSIHRVRFVPFEPWIESDQSQVEEERELELSLLFKAACSKPESLKRTKIALDAQIIL